MIIRKKTLEKMLRDAKQEVWDSVRKQDSERSIWDQIRRLNNDNYKLKKVIAGLDRRIEAIEGAKGGKK